MSIWDDPELREGGELVKLENKGDKISGVITALRSHRFEDGKVVPQVLFTDDVTGEDRTWTAGQVQAKAKLAQLRPDEGDWFSAELADIEKRTGGKTLKHIEIVVNRGGKPAAVSSPAAAASVVPAAGGQDLAAVFAALSPDEKAKLLAGQNNSSPGI